MFISFIPFVTFAFCSGDLGYASSIATRAVSRPLVRSSQALGNRVENHSSTYFKRGSVLCVCACHRRITVVNQAQIHVRTPVPDLFRQPLSVAQMRGLGADTHQRPIEMEIR